MRKNKVEGSRKMTYSLKHVESFWNRNLCGKHFINSRYPSEEFFNRYREFRYRKEHHLVRLIDWESSQNKDVLEIGIGIGADATRWAKYAHSYTGIDLTSEAVFATQLHLKLLSLNGHVIRGNAEFLPFSDNKFDLVYSYGVLHHTQSIESALSEISRVLKRNGQLILMLYTKNSFNYWIRIQLYYRLKFLFELLKYKIGLNVNCAWVKHIKNFYNEGRMYFSWKNWHHHYTDGPDCKIANIYYKKEIRKLVENAGLKIKEMRKVHFPVRGKYPSLECFIAKYLGFYQLVWGIK